MKCVTGLDCDSIPPVGLVGLAELPPPKTCCQVTSSVILSVSACQIYYVGDAYVHDVRAIRAVEAERVVQERL
jgi:hypothetical protein